MKTAYGKKRTSSINFLKEAKPSQTTDLLEAKKNSLLGIPEEQILIEPNLLFFRPKVRRDTYSSSQASNDYFAAPSKPTHKRTISGSQDYFSDLICLSINQSPAGSDLGKQNMKIPENNSKVERSSIIEYSEAPNKIEKISFHINTEKPKSLPKTLIKRGGGLEDFNEMIKLIQDREDLVKREIQTKRKIMKDRAILSIRHVDASDEDPVTSRYSDVVWRSASSNYESDNVVTEPSKGKNAYGSDNNKKEKKKINLDGFFKKNEDIEFKPKVLFENADKILSNHPSMIPRKINLGKGSVKITSKPKEKSEKSKIQAKIEARTGHAKGLIKKPASHKAFPEKTVDIPSENLRSNLIGHKIGQAFTKIN